MRVQDGELVRSVNGTMFLDGKEIRAFKDLEIQINGIWHKGFIDYWPHTESLLWTSVLDNVLVVLRSGMKARFA